MKWFVVGVIGLLVILFLFGQPLSIPPNGSSGGSGSDTNQVAVSANDNLADYLFSKLQAGTGISLAIQNPGGDENILISTTGSPGDTNCAVTGSCPNVAYTNTDENFLDLNATLLTVQDGSSAIKFKYGLSSKGIEIPYPTGCTEIFGVEGFANTGLQFCGGSLVGIGLPVLGSYNFFVNEGGDQVGSVHMLPVSVLAEKSGLPNFQKGALIQTRNDKDGNHVYSLISQLLGWKQFHHSVYAPDFLFQSGDFNNTSDKNQLRFLGYVDFNGGIDVNQNSTFALDLNVGQNVDIDQNLNVDGNLYGQVVSWTGGNTVSCNTLCASISYNGPWVCRETDTILGVAGSCADTAGTRNCLCQN